MASRTRRSTVTLLITDLDNTLWDWFAAWHASFSSMLDTLSALTGIPQTTLLPEIRAVHQLRGTTEYSNLLNELPSLRRISSNPMADFDEAIHAQNSARKRATQLYPGVIETLIDVRRGGVPIVAYTESVSFWTEWRIKTLGLDGVIDSLYSAPDHDLPAGTTFAEMRTLPPESYGLKRTAHRHVPKGISKPAPLILSTILNEYRATPLQTAYVGDSLFKDISMAQAVGALDVHAAYGVTQTSAEYDLLRAVTHWSDSTVQRERETLAGRGAPTPRFTLSSNFREILSQFNFRNRSGL